MPRDSDVKVPETDDIEVLRKGYEELLKNYTAVRVAENRVVALLSCACRKRGPLRFRPSVAALRVTARSHASLSLRRRRTMWRRNWATRSAAFARRPRPRPESRLPYCLNNYSAGLSLQSCVPDGSPGK